MTAELSYFHIYLCISLLASPTLGSLYRVTRQGTELHTGNTVTLIQENNVSVYGSHYFPFSVACCGVTSKRESCDQTVLQLCLSLKVQVHEIQPRSKHSTPASHQLALNKVQDYTIMKHSVTYVQCIQLQIEYFDIPPLNTQCSNGLYI